MADTSSSVKVMRAMVEAPHSCNSGSAVVLRGKRLQTSVSSYAAAGILACACCRQLWPLLRKASRRAVEIGEQMADEEVSEQTREKIVRTAIEAAVNSWGTAVTFEKPANMAYRCAINDGRYAAEWTVGFAG